MRWFFDLGMVLAAGLSLSLRPGGAEAAGGAADPTLSGAVRAGRLEGEFGVNRTGCAAYLGIGVVRGGRIVAGSYAVKVLDAPGSLRFGTDVLPRLPAGYSGVVVGRRECDGARALARPLLVQSPQTGRVAGSPLAWVRLVKRRFRVGDVPSAAEPASPAGPEAEDSDAHSSVEQEIGRLVNVHRQSIGRGPLVLHPRVSSVARGHSLAMATGRTPFGHQGMDARASEVKRFLPSSSWGENVAYGQDTAASVMKGWLASPGHRRNIEGDFTHLGVGAAKNREGMPYYTQFFTKARP